MGGVCSALNAIDQVSNIADTSLELMDKAHEKILKPKHDCGSLFNGYSANTGLYSQYSSVSPSAKRFKEALSKEMTQAHLENPKLERVGWGEENYVAAKLSANLMNHFWLVESFQPEPFTLNEKLKFSYAVDTSHVTTQETDAIKRDIHPAFETLASTTSKTDHDYLNAALKNKLRQKLQVTPAVRRLIKNSYMEGLTDIRVATEKSQAMTLKRAKLSA